MSVSRLLQHFLQHRFLRLAGSQLVAVAIFVALSFVLLRVRKLGTEIVEQFKASSLMLSVPAVEGSATENPEGSPRYCALPTIVVHALLVVAIAIPAFWFNRANLLSYIDGQYLLTLVQSQHEFAPFRLGFSTNPLQGLDDLAYFSNTRWIPELAIAAIIPDGTWQKIGIQTTAAVELFIAVGLLAAWVGATPGKAAAAGWLAVLAISPLSYPSLFYAVTPDGPQVVSLILMAIIIVPLWVGIGKGPLWQDPLWAIAISLLAWIQATAFGLFFALTAPFLTVFGVVFLVASRRNRAELIRKLTWGACILIVLTVSGLPQAMLGIADDSSFHFFREQAFRQEHPLSDGSLLFRPSERISWGLAMLGLAGALFSFRFGNERTRYFATATLALVALIVAASVTYAEFGYIAAIPIYFEYVLWPIYAMFAVFITCDGGRLIRSDYPKRHALPFAREWLLPMAPFVILVLWHGSNVLHKSQNGRPNIYPPRRLDITDFLSNEVGLMRDSLFRGRVVTMTGQRLPAQASWNEMFGLDLGVIGVIGNELRTIGLWYYTIPTLVEFSHTIPPLFYVVVTRYLVPSGDVQQRNILNMRLPNLRILRLLGVRYIVTDGDVTPGTDRRRMQAMPNETPALAVDEISDVNLGLSPVETVPLVSIGAALAWLEDKKVDFTRTAMLPGSGTGPLIAARDISIRIVRGGWRVRAKSDGHSLLVVPFAFSNCLKVVRSENASTPELLRADLLLTGIIFDGALDATIKYHQGPFENASCRLKDFGEIESFGDF
jgi:hypothetical protein